MHDPDYTKPATGPWDRVMTPEDLKTLEKMMLKIAVPNKGALADSAGQMLAEAGYRQRRNAKDLVTLDPDNDVEFFYLRPRDIAIYVGEGTLDVGITGRDLLLDSGAHANEEIALGFGASTFRVGFTHPGRLSTNFGFPGNLAGDSGFIVAVP